MERRAPGGLALPRYVPFAMRGTRLAVWYDSEENRYLVQCPRCHQLIEYRSADIIYREMVWNERQCCQGCRARITFEWNPNVIGVILDFCHRTGGFPESLSWLEAIPAHQFSLWAKEIHAALKSEEDRQGPSLGAGGAMMQVVDEEANAAGSKRS